MPNMGFDSPRLHCYLTRKELVMKKKEKTEEFETLGVANVIDYGKTPIPEGATDFYLEADYSNCYYEGDRPDYIVTFYKKKS
jgi:hypothetical protein